MKTPLPATDVSARRSLKTLTKSDIRTLGLATLGGALEFYDFIIFVFFANQIGQLFFPAEIPDWLRQSQTFGLFAVGYFVRPLSGTIMGHFGDLIGRKRIFTFSILLMAAPTLAIGLLPSYNAIGVIAPIALLILRVLQGAAIGGEIPGAWVFVSEHLPSNRVSLACGTLGGRSYRGDPARFGRQYWYHQNASACRDHAHRLAHRISARWSFWYLRCLAPTMAAGDAGLQRNERAKSFGCRTAD
jgi:Sugar (and other) transporter